MSDIYLSITETPTVVTLTNPLISSNVAQSVTVTNVVSVNVVTMPAITVQAAAPAVTTVAGTVSIANFPSTQSIAGTVTVSKFDVDAFVGVIASDAGGEEPANGVQLGYFDVGAGFKIVNEATPLPISGTVTANDSGALTIVNSSTVTKADVKFAAIAGAYNPTDAAPTYTLRPLKTTPSGTLLVDGTSSAGGSVIDYDGFAYVRVAQSPGSVVTIGSCVTHGVRLQDGSGNNLSSTSIGGLQRLNVSLASAATPGGSLPSFINVYGGSDGSAVRTISVDSFGRQNTNAQFPRVTLIDGSGTVTTANTAITVFASSSTRSYLLVQVTTGSAFVNVGATATTVNGINLTAGQGYAWETTIPQGIVSLISTTTSSRYVAKEA